MATPGASSAASPSKHLHASGMLDTAEPHAEAAERRCTPCMHGRMRALYAGSAQRHCMQDGAGRAQRLTAKTLEMLMKP
jgi:hypothetical protein